MATEIPADPSSITNERSLIQTQVSDAAASLAVTEIALGSVVHGFKIPLGGHLLSLNQGAFLTHVTKSLKAFPGAYRFSLYVSNISAVLKSLSPAGNKLGPMLSISAQGFLYAASIALLGANWLGASVGMILLSLWAFIQPFITLYIFYGNDLAHAIEFYLQKMDSSFGITVSSVVLALTVLVVVKALLGVAIGIAVFRSSDAQFKNFQKKIRFKNLTQRTLPQPTSTVNHSQIWFNRIKLTLRDLSRPLFLTSILLMGVFFFFMEHSWSKTIWLLLRPLALAFVFFYLSRSPLLGRATNWLRRFHKFDQFMSLLDQTLLKIRKKENDSTETQA